MPEILVILAVALIVIGPKKLPELAKTLGKAFGEFRRSINDLKDSVEVTPEENKKLESEKNPEEKKDEPE